MYEFICIESPFPVKPNSGFKSNHNCLSQPFPGNGTGMFVQFVPVGHLALLTASASITGFVNDGSTLG